MDFSKNQNQDLISGLVNECLHDEAYVMTLQGGILPVITEENVNSAVKAAVYCCCAGPVGVTKKAFNYDGVTFSLQERFKCTSSGWKRFCFTVADTISSIGGLDMSSYNMVRRFGELWPYCDVQLQKARE